MKNSVEHQVTAIIGGIIPIPTNNTLIGHRYECSLLEIPKPSKIAYKY
jgi:hypothetical protein